MLAMRQGRRSEAESHLARAEGLYGDAPGLLFYGLDAVRAELALAVGDTERTVAVAMAGVERGSHAEPCRAADPAGGEGPGGRSAGTPGPRRGTGAGRGAPHDLRARYPRVVAEGEPGPAYPVQVRAMQAWYEAEVARGLAHRAAGTAWQHAAQACADGDLAWDEAYAWWRAAEALAKDRATRDAAASTLRRAHQLAMDLHAAPLVTEIQALAQSARVSVAAIQDSRPAEAATMPGLTPREREILAYIVAGRTYSEIARELVLSEKTVSVHVSNLLHKTGTANRVELAQLARRVQT